MQKTDVRKLTTVAALIAVEIVLSRFCSISTPIVKIGFGFLPVAVCAMLYGPWWAAGVAATADFLGAVLFPIGAYFPGFTLTAALMGAVYGFALCGHGRSWLRIIGAVCVVSIALHLCLDTLWLTMISGSPFAALLPVRVIKCAIMIPVQAVLIRAAGETIYALPQVFGTAN